MRQIKYIYLIFLIIIPFNVYSEIQVEITSLPVSGSLSYEQSMEAGIIDAKPPIHYVWDFGDGNVSYEPNPIHSYETPGEYRIWLNILDAEGQTGNDVLWIQVRHDVFQKDQLIFNHFLDASVATCIYSDNYQPNLTWIGTKGGLICMDFENNTQHYYRSNLPSGKVNDISQLFDKSIWIATTNGLVRFDPDSNSWTTFNSQNSVITENHVYTLATTLDKKKLWIGTMGGGIYSWDAVQKNWTVYSAKDYDLPTNHIYDITVDSQNNLWVATHRGLVALNTSTSKWQVYNTDNSDLPDNVLNVVCSSTNGNIWIGTWNQGIVSFDSVKNEFKHYNQGNSPLTINFIDKLISSPNGLIWISSQEKGLFRLNPSDDSWQHYTKNNSNFPYSSIFCVAPKEDNSLIISVKDYIIKCDEYMNIKSSLILIQRHLPDNYIACMKQSKRKDLWLGFRNNGLIRLKPDLNQWTQWHPMNSQIPSYDVKSIVEMTDGHIVIGTSNGLAFYNENSRIWSVFQTQNSALPANVVTAVLYDKNAYLWIGTSNGVSRLNPFTLKWENFDSDTNNNEQITCLTQTTDGRIWAGTAKNGLLAFKEDDNTWEIINQGNSELSDNHIKTILGNTSLNLWIGTLYDGLIQYNYVSQKWTTYNTSNSALLNNNISALAVSPDSVLWIGDNKNHIYRFHPLTLEWHTVKLNENDSDMTSTSEIITQMEDDLWLGTQGSGLFHMKWPRELDSPGNLIIIQGENLLVSEKTQKIHLENIYSTFSSKGFKHKDIMMISRTQKIDFNGDGIPDSIIDKKPYVYNIKDALLNWSVSNYSPGNSLFIFILGQWSINSETQIPELQLPDNQSISALDFHDSFSLYEQETGGQIVAVINGTNVDQLLKNISSRARTTIVTEQSQTEINNAFSYASFMNYFLEGLEKELSVYDSFKHSQKKLTFWKHKEIESYLDDNGDGISDILDGIFANKVHLTKDLMDTVLPEIKDIDFSTINSDSFELTVVFNTRMSFVDAILHNISSDNKYIPININMAECNDMTFCGGIIDITPTGRYELEIMARNVNGRIIISEPLVVNIGNQQYGGIEGYINILLGKHKISFNEARLEVHLPGTEYKAGIHSDGRFSFENIPQGTYKMEIIGPNFTIEHGENILIDTGEIKQLEPIEYDILSYVSSSNGGEGLSGLKDVIMILQKLVNGNYLNN